MSAVTRTPLPLILVRGFGGLGVEDEKKMPYQGFNDGTVYPRKRGPNYIYEGMILRFMKSDWQYQDATNVIGYYGRPIVEPTQIPPELEHFDKSFFFGSAEPADEASRYKIVIDPGTALSLLQRIEDPLRTLWVFRYYDLDERSFPIYGEALVRLIDFVRALAAKTSGVAKPTVNIIAHSMGGLLVREAIQSTYPKRGERAEDYINKVVTLGTPHQGISFALLKEWINIDAEEELQHFNPDFQKDKSQDTAFVRFSEFFPTEPAPHGGRDELPVVRPRWGVDAQSPLLGGRGGGTDLQPQRRARQAGVRPDSGEPADVRAQVPRWTGLARDGAGVVRGGAALLLRATCMPGWV